MSRARVTIEFTVTDATQVADALEALADKVDAIGVAIADYRHRIEYLDEPSGTITGEGSAVRG